MRTRAQLASQSSRDVRALRRAEQLEQAIAPIVQRRRPQRIVRGDYEFSWRHTNQNRPGPFQARIVAVQEIYPALSTVFLVDEQTMFRRPDANDDEQVFLDRPRSREPTLFVRRVHAPRATLYQATLYRENNYLYDVENDDDVMSQCYPGFRAMLSSAAYRAYSDPNNTPPSAKPLFSDASIRFHITQVRNEFNQRVYKYVTVHLNPDMIRFGMVVNDVQDGDLRSMFSSALTELSTRAQEANANGSDAFEPTFEIVNLTFAGTMNRLQRGTPLRDITATNFGQEFTISFSRNEMTPLGVVPIREVQIPGRVGTPRYVLNDYRPFGGCRDKIMDLIAGTNRFDVVEETSRIVKGNSKGCKIDLNNLVVWCPSVKNNNCFFACIKYICLLEEQKIDNPHSITYRDLVAERVDKWRRELDIPMKKVTNLDHIKRFVDHILKFRVVIYDEHMRVIADIEPQEYRYVLTPKKGWQAMDKRPFQLVLFREHFFVLLRKSLQQFSCETCGMRNIVNLDKHLCNPVKVNYFQVMKRQKISYYDKRPQQNALVDPTRLFIDILYYDFETFFNGVKHQVYAVGAMHIKEDGNHYFCFTGEVALETFMMYLEEMMKEGRKLTLVSYNGSNFDHYFILEKQLSDNLPMDEFLMNKGRLLQINFFGHKVLDLYNFLGPVSLDANCAAYQIELRKSIFPHLYARSWKDLQYVGPLLGPEYYPAGVRGKYDEWKKDHEYFNFMEECEVYLQRDVECLQLLGEKFITEMWTQFNIYVPHYLTLSQVAFDLWRSTLDPKIMIPLPVLPDLYHKTNEATYGGRCHFVKRFFKSSQVDLPYDQITDYLIDLDVVSLYPASMLSGEFPHGDVKHWHTTDALRVLHECMMVNDLPIGIYEVIVECPTHYIVPVLPRKNAKGHTVWDLKFDSKPQCYTSIDIRLGLEHGYRFTILSAYVWNGQAPLFNTYIHDVFQRKAHQDVLKKSKDAAYNPAARELFKKLMNALYGKMMQKRQSVDHEIFDASNEENQSKWLNFLDAHSAVEYHDIGQQMLVVGERNEFSKTVTKPHYLGAFILSHSRAIMNKYFDMLDPMRKSPLCDYDWQKSLDNSFFYTDTDSIIANASQLESMKSAMGSELGLLSDELAGGKIIEGYFLSPKVYCVKYMMPDGSLHEKRRAKGIPNHLLDMQQFRNMYFDNDPTRYDFVQLRRLQETLNQPQEDKCMEPFTIISVPDAHRSLNPAATYGKEGVLGGRKILPNVKDSVPLGFQNPNQFDVLMLLVDDDDEEEEHTIIDSELDALFKMFQSDPAIQEHTLYDFEDYDI